MDTPSTSKRLLSNSEGEFDRSITDHSTGFDESFFSADVSLNTTRPSSTDKDTFKSTPPSRPPIKIKQMSSQKKSPTELFPWLIDVEKSAQKCLGSIPEAKSKTVLNIMDFLIRKLNEDCQKYCKSPRLSIVLARYIREFLYTYRHLYKGFEMGIEFFRRVTKLLVTYSDLELCGSMSGQECDNEIANRIQLIYTTHLEGSEDFTVLDIFISMKRLSRIHRGVLSLLLKHFLVKITVKEPVEIDDDTFVKYLIVFKKWLAIEDIYEDKEDIRSAFITQAKPKKMFCMNSKYAPYLPADDNGQKTSDNYVRMLDKKFSLQPLLQALELTDKSSGEPSTSGITKKLNEVVILSDDEENNASEVQLVNVKTETDETSDNSSVIDETSKPELIDLTEEPFEESNAPRLYISWLADLVERAKIKPTIMEQRLEGANISTDVIVIDDPEENDETNKKSSDESQSTKITSVNVSSIATSTTTTTISTHETQTDASTDSGSVLTNREEVGIHWNNKFEMCPSSVNVEHIDETQANENQLCQQAQAGHGNIIAKPHHLSNDENSSECNAFNVSSSDGNKTLLPINMNNVASGSISSCSDEAAEQLLTVALKNQRLNDHLPTSDLIDKVQITSDVDCTVESTSLLFEPTSSDCLPQPSQMPEPSTATVYRRLQLGNDKNLTINFDLKTEELDTNDESIVPESVNDVIDEYNVKMLRSQAKKNITVVHPIRHNQLPINTVCKSDSTADLPQDMTNATSSTSSMMSQTQKKF